MKSHLTSALFTIAFAIVVFSAQAFGQSLSFNYKYNLQLTENIDKAPNITGLDDVDFPEQARKNGITGVVKAELILGEDGKSRDITITQGLPYGVTEAVTKVLKTIYFEPARLEGKTVPVKLLFEFHISSLYGENDKAVNKAKITYQPQVSYPASYTGERVKGKVEVTVHLLANLTVRVLNATSTMPRAFDLAAMEAAKEVKFEPAVHKKSKETVSQQATVVFEFK